MRSMLFHDFRVSSADMFKMKTKAGVCQWCILKLPWCISVLE